MTGYNLVINIFLLLYSSKVVLFNHELILAYLRMLFCHWKMLFIFMTCKSTKLSYWSLWLSLFARLFLESLSLSSRTIMTVPLRLFFLFYYLTIFFLRVWYFLTKTTCGIFYYISVKTLCWMIWIGSVLSTLNLKECIS